VNNPEPALRDRTVLCAWVIEGLSPEPGEPTTWSGGTVYDPTSGRTYGARMTPAGENRLLVRGYIGFRFIGRTTTWIRVGSEGPCHDRPGPAPPVALESSS
jgi:uncharacterized protein (DUF2147 family)